MRALLLAGCLWLGGGALLHAGLSARLAAFGDPVAAVDGGGSVGLREDKRLFDRLWGLGLITADADGRRLELPPADWTLRELQRLTAAGRTPTDDWLNRRDALRDLFGTGNGRRVAADIGVGNLAQWPLAVRDNAEATAKLAPSWRVTAADRTRRPALPLHVPGSFSGFVDTAVPGLSEWVVFGTDGPRPITLSTTFSRPYPAGGLVVQVLGRVDETAPPAGWRYVGACRTGAPDTTRGTEPGAACLEHVFRAPADAPDNLQFEIAVTPVGSDRHWGIRELTPVAHDEGGDWRWRGDVRPWRDGERGREPGVTTIVTADGVTVSAGDDGGPTAAAIELGLLPVVGGGDDDPRGVPGQVARRRDRAAPATVALTIDSRVQAAAFGALTAAMETPFTNGGGKSDPFAALRRAALTVIDPATGAILAAASWPPPPSGLDPWTVNAYSFRNPAADPFTPTAWSGIDGERGPGSTFKPVVSLSLMSAASTEPRIRSLIEGCAPLADGTLPCLGFKTSATGYAMPPQGAKKQVHNFRNTRGGYQTAGESLGPDKLERAPECVGGLRLRPGSVGLRQSIKDSLNATFVRGADLLDGEESRRYDFAMRRIPKGGKFPAPPTLRLVETMRLLGFDRPIDLAGSARELLGDNAAFGASALTAEAARADAFDLLERPPHQAGRVDWNELGAVDTVSRTAIGQQVYATPLQMARVAAAVRDGAVPTPHLLGSWNGRTLTPPVGVPLPDMDRAPLIDGMKSVPETGTAAGAKAFGRWDGTPAQQAKCAVFGKTGTSDVKGRAPHTTAWFIGWAEREAFTTLAATLAGGTGTSETPSGWNRQVAFACMITHGVGERRTGGGLCAPVVADLLDRLARSPSIPTASIGRQDAAALADRGGTTP